MKHALEKQPARPDYNTGDVIRAYFLKMKGIKRLGRQASIVISELFITALGSFIAIGITSFLANYYRVPLLLPSFGASVALIFAIHNAPMAQPRNVFGGQVISAIAGVLVYQFLGSAWWAVALGVTLAIVAMRVTYTLHPPGGATAFIAVHTCQNYDFILAPVALGAAGIILIGLIINNLSSKRKYPQYWF